MTGDVVRGVVESGMNLVASEPSCDGSADCGVNDADRTASGSELDCLSVDPGSELTESAAAVPDSEGELESTTSACGFDESSAKGVQAPESVAPESVVLANQDNFSMIVHGVFSI